MKVLLFCAAFALGQLGLPLLAAQDLVREENVRPSQANSAVMQYDEANVILTPIAANSSTPLALFLPGTGGKPENAKGLLHLVADQGYRVIGLSYNDEPSVSQICPRSPQPSCFANFRSVRTFGRGSGPVNNSYAESIEGRLSSLLRYLNTENPEAGWSAYLTDDGKPQWSRILVSGLSQGAGMAAFIAKSHPVYRVVLFSSPWDNVGPEHRPAPWLSEPSATPMDRWWAERHVRENTTDLIANAYSALRLLPDHILHFDGGLTAEQNPQASNPFHTSTIRNPVYEAQWRKMYGKPAL